MKAFVLNLEAAEEFYTCCMDRNAVTEEERVKIMNELVHEYNIKILKNEEQLAKELAGKKVLNIKNKAA